MKARALAMASLAIVFVVSTAARVTAQTDEDMIPCGECHDTLAATFTTNPHARALGRAAADWQPCAACHAGAKEHVEAGGDASLIKIPRGADGVATCISCHGARDAHGIEARSIHTQAGVPCTTCHAIHDAAPLAQALLRKPGSGLCVGCHPDVASQLHKPYTHPMDSSASRAGTAGMQCASCHNPHGRREAALRMDRSGEPVCLTCHTDKRGPFVFSHGATVAGECTSCHQPHGSANPMLLTRSRVSQLCLECHTGLPSGGLGSQPPSLHDLRSPRYQNCTSCHVAIHGSNSSPRLLR